MAFIISSHTQMHIEAWFHWLARCTYSGLVSK